MSVDRSEQSSEEFSSAAELAAFIDNDLENENDDIYPHAGKVKGDNLDFMNFMSEVYEGDRSDMPYRFKNTKMGRMMTKATATRIATKAVDEGNISQMKFISGKQNYSNDISSIHTLINLRNVLGQDAYIQYLYGHMGNGKTDFAILQAELAHRELGYDISTNIKSLAEAHGHIQYVPKYGDLLKWLAEGESVKSIDEIAGMGDVSAENKIFIFDEASSHASGYSDDAYETQKKLGTLVKKIRKVGGSLIIIGHTGKDVHPDIRRITNDCVSKTGKKSATYYKSVEEGKGKGKKFELSGIPKTNWNEYDTLEITKWDWSDVPTDEENETKDALEQHNISKERRDKEIVKAIATNQHPRLEPDEKGNITVEALADHYDLTIGRISQIGKEYIENGREAQAD